MPAPCQLDLIKGWGRAMVRERIVVAASRQLVILVGEEKLVPRLGTRGKLPVEVVPFGLSLCERRLARMGCRPVPARQDGRLFVTDNGNNIVDLQITPIADAARGWSRTSAAFPASSIRGCSWAWPTPSSSATARGFRLVEELRRSQS